MLHVESARSELRPAALEILLQEFPPDDRPAHISETLAADARGEVSLDGLLIAREDGAALGAELFLLQPDGCGFVWPPVVVPHVSAPKAEQVADALLQAVCQRLDECGAWIGQALLEPGNEVERRESRVESQIRALSFQLSTLNSQPSTLNSQRLRRNGFDYLTDLTYLRRTLPNHRDSTPPSGELGIDHWNPERDRDRLAAIIERTYNGSADCPQLNGLRTGHEAVAAHHLTGVPLPDGWTTFRDSTGDVGVLVLADQPDQDACELVYMGVVPEARGRGYGREIVSTAVRTAAAHGRRELLLAVDERNRFAGRIYEQAGFEAFDRKCVFVRAGKGRQSEPSTSSARLRP